MQIFPLMREDPWMWKGDYYFFLPDAAFLALDLALEAALLAALLAFFPRRSDFIS
jgi:hypothetical protein